MDIDKVRTWRMRGIEEAADEQPLYCRNLP
jgi:hypothetical protein